MSETRNILEWREEYSVGVKLIDDQHRRMFEIINELVEMINGVPKAEELAPVLAGLVEYKQKHFATEEGYFRQFGFEGSDEHIAEHRNFDETIERLKAGRGDNTIGFTFDLVDFLEDWLVNHILHTDRKYIECFHMHGLR